MGAVLDGPFLPFLLEDDAGVGDAAAARIQQEIVLLTGAVQYRLSCCVLPDIVYDNDLCSTTVKTTCTCAVTLST